MTDDSLTPEHGTFRSQLRIEAPPEVVITYFTDPIKMARWMGIDHKLDPVPGGVFMVDVNGRDVAVGEYFEVSPTRVVFTWGWREQDDLPPGSSTVEVNLTSDGDATILDFAHHGLPTAERRDSHAQGWGYYLTRLEATAAGREPGPDEYVTSTPPGDAPPAGPTA